jgi:hypothetical protein
MRKTVVFPLPDGPTMVKNSPSAIDRSMLCAAVKLPNVLVICRSSMTGERVIMQYDAESSSTGFRNQRAGLFR